VIERHQKPTLVLAHNKTWRPSCTPNSGSFFRTTPSSITSATSTTTSPRLTYRAPDTYIEKDSSRNDEIDKLRHSGDEGAVRAARRDHRRQRELHLRPRRPIDYGGHDPAGCVWAGNTGATPFCATSYDLQYQRNDATLVAGPASACGATRWS